MVLAGDVGCEAPDFFDHVMAKEMTEKAEAGPDSRPWTGPTGRSGSDARSGVPNRLDGDHAAPGFFAGHPGSSMALRTGVVVGGRVSDLEVDLVARLVQRNVCVTA